MLLLYCCRVRVTHAPAQEFANKLNSQLHTIPETELGRQTFTLLGAPAFLGPATTAVEKDMAMMDGICIPIALFILWFMLRTWRLMLVPMATVIVSAFTSFAIMFLVSLKLRVFTVVVCGEQREHAVCVYVGWLIPAPVLCWPQPSLMMSLVLAVSIDYSLFLLVRYRVELGQGTPHLVAVEQMIRYAGQTIAISGLVLALCFYGLTIFPLESIRTMGIACGTVVLVVLAANETLLPVTLLLFPTFFEQSASSACYEAVARGVSVVCVCCPGKASHGGKGCVTMIHD